MLTVEKKQVNANAGTNNLYELAKSVNFRGDVRLRVHMSKRSDARHPGKYYLYPINEGEWDKIVDDLEIPLELPSDRDDGRTRRVQIYGVSAFLGELVEGKDFRFALRPNRSGTTVAAFPIDHRFLGNGVWQPSTLPTTFEIVFSKRSGDSGWTATHPITGQRIVAMMRDTDWKIESDDGKTSRVYRPGELAIRRTVTSTILVVGPIEDLKRIRDDHPALLDDKSDEAKAEGQKVYELHVLTQEPVYPLGEYLVPAGRIVGGFLECTDAEAEQMLRNVKIFKRALLKKMHPDIANSAEIVAITDDEERDNAILLANEDRFKSIQPALDDLVAWLTKRQELSKLTRDLYEKQGLEAPKLKINPPVYPKGYKPPKELMEGGPLTHRPIEEIIKILFTPPKKAVKKDPKPRTQVKKITTTTAVKPATTTRRVKAAEPVVTTDPSQIEKFTKRSRATRGATPHVDQETRTVHVSGGEIRNSLGDALRAKGVKPEDFAGKGVEPGKRLGASFVFAKCACGKTHKMPVDYKGGDLTECPPKKSRKK